jgi:hypothetical protein
MRVRHVSGGRECAHADVRRVAAVAARPQGRDMTGSFARGLLAGAAGTTALHAATYLDLAVRGRPASSLPGQAVDVLAARTGRRFPGRGRAREFRRTALGALAGIGNGLAVGVLASVSRSAGLRFSAPLGAVVTGATSLAATDAPLAALGITDPRRWTAADWLADAGPHLAYGAAAQAVLSAVPTPAEHARPRHPAGAGLTARAALLGLATGGRSSLGLAAPTLTATGGGGKKLAAAGSVAGELVADKLPGVPDRTGRGPLQARLVLGAGGGGRLAARAQADAGLPVLAGAVGAVAGSFSGRAWRRWAAARMPDWQGAVLEDVVALALAALATLPGRDRVAPPTLVVVPN